MWDLTIGKCVEVDDDAVLSKPEHGEIGKHVNEDGMTDKAFETFCDDLLGVTGIRLLSSSCLDDDIDCSDVLTSTLCASVEMITGLVDLEQ